MSNDNEKPVFPLMTQRHSLSHVMAQAAQRVVDPDAKLGIWPAIDTWFYYDFIFNKEKEFGEKNLKEIQKTMQQIVKEWQLYAEYESNFEESKEILTMFWQEFKTDLLKKFQEEGDTKVTYWLNIIPEKQAEHILKSTLPAFKTRYDMITAYFQKKMPELKDKYVLFADLCEWPHVDTTRDLDPSAFALDKLAGAYRRGDEKNPMMTRIYGLAFENKAELKEYQAMMEEAKKRDHRKLGAELKLFTLSPLIGAWLPLMQPKGMIIRTETEKYLWELHERHGYSRVRTPHIAKEDLYKTSGHYDKFGDELFRVQGKDDNFFMKPMNCPHHMQLYADQQFSYRDMPVRYFEPATVYRDEKTGQLSGLTRVRCITQDDGHLFCRPSQIKQEVGTIVDIIKQFYTTLGMVDNYRVSLSVRGDDGKMYLGANDVRELAENSLEEAAQANDLPYRRIEGEAAFYGPKLDFMFKDAIGRERQLATIQCDFNLPERFDLTYINEEGEKERPVVIHRAIAWSLERFMGVMIEHFAGAFPVWLAPTQAIVVPVVEKFNPYGYKVQQQLKNTWLRIDIDDSNDSLNKKIRNAEKMKIPYILVVGEQEETTKWVAVREYASKKQYEMMTEAFGEKLIKEYESRALIAVTDHE